MFESSDYRGSFKENFRESNLKRARTWFKREVWEIEIWKEFLSKYKNDWKLGEILK